MDERWQKQTDQLDESAATQALLTATGIATGDLAAITASIVRRGWAWRLTGGDPANPDRCSAAIIGPWHDATPWAEGQGDGPAAALGQALARAIANPPPDDVEIAKRGSRIWRVDDRPRALGK
jgi:hypothetical protein